MKTVGLIVVLWLAVVLSLAAFRPVPEVDDRAVDGVLLPASGNTLEYYDYTEHRDGQRTILGEGVRLVRLRDDGHDELICFTVDDADRRTGLALQRYAADGLLQAQYFAEVGSGRAERISSERVRDAYIDSPWTFEDLRGHRGPGWTQEPLLNEARNGEPRARVATVPRSGRGAPVTSYGRIVTLIDAREKRPECLYYYLPDGTLLKEMQFNLWTPFAENPEVATPHLLQVIRHVEPHAVAVLTLKAERFGVELAAAHLTPEGLATWTPARTDAYKALARGEVEAAVVFAE